VKYMKTYHVVAPCHTVGTEALINGQRSQNRAPHDRISGSCVPGCDAKLGTVNDFSEVRMNTDEIISYLKFLVKVGLAGAATALIVFIINHV